MKQEICKVAHIPQTGSLIAPFFGREVHVWRSGERAASAAWQAPAWIAAP